jgi:cytochrome b subunit of formate dehydrogenase
MTKQSRLLALNMAMLVLFIAQAAIGVRLWFVELLGWEDSEFWMNMHLITGFSLIVLIAIHIYMNRRWIEVQISGPKGNKR